MDDDTTNENHVNHKATAGKTEKTMKLIAGQYQIVSNDLYQTVDSQTKMTLLDNVV
jgi:hypothetical protein